MGLEARIAMLGLHRY